MLDFNIKEVSWGDIRNEVSEINLELANICDQIDPSQRHSLYKIRYPYGAKIIDNGVLNLPLSNNELVNINDERVPLEIRNKLSYCSIPLSLILHNKNEVFIEANNRVIPLNFFQPGEFFGIFETNSLLMGTNLNPIWTVTAGARSVFMIPKISDKIEHGRIKKEFGVAVEAPTDLLNQWEVFKAIFNHAGGLSSWYNEILVFSDKWVQADRNEVAWLKFNEYLFKINWQQSELLRSSIAFSAVWTAFNENVNNRCLRPRPYIMDTLKRLVSIANGIGVGFKPATDDSAIPIKATQNIYSTCYNLRYTPTIMQPCKLRADEQIVYYSLALPLVLESSPISKNAPSIIEDEREIRVLVGILLKTINQVNPKDSLNRNVEYEFFHTDIDKYGEILNSKEILSGDNRFGPLDNYPGRLFCATSLFFRGCIRIKNNNDLA